MLLVVTPDSSILAFSAASFRRCMATLSPLRSMPSDFLNSDDQILHDALVEVIAAQAVVAGGGQHLDHAVIDLQDGHIEGAAAQVVDHDLLCLLLIHTVGQCGGGGLVDDTLHVQAGDLAGVLGGLTLGCR